eukprot:TRINITY_DN37897_c0_g1_i1.p1 TRINITY_DN37897_c0_g1~~TRINITY_DN37897_c0_g1_i1.p1  ORF type:complete len:284 (-),score=51.73 TRINITY_DN37897_c0_g1_i1:88-891(-)
MACGDGGDGGGGNEIARGTSIVLATAAPSVSFGAGCGGYDGGDGGHNVGGHLPSLVVGGRAGAETPNTSMRKTVISVRDKVVTRVDGAQKARVELEDSLTRVKETYEGLLVLLKELELGRIDLQATATWLSTQRQNWKFRHSDCKRFFAPPELDKRLADEELFFAGEVKEADQQIAHVSQQVARLREVRDGLARRLAEQRRVVLRHGGVLETIDREGRLSHGATRWPTPAPLASARLGGSGGSPTQVAGRNLAAIPPLARDSPRRRC